MGAKGEYTLLNIVGLWVSATTPLYPPVVGWLFRESILGILRLPPKPSIGLKATEIPVLMTCTELPEMPINSMTPERDCLLHFLWLSLYLWHTPNSIFPSDKVSDEDVSSSHHPNNTNGISTKNGA